MPGWVVAPVQGHYWVADLKKSYHHCLLKVEAPFELLVGQPLVERFHRSHYAYLKRRKKDAQFVRPPPFLACAKNAAESTNDLIGMHEQLRQ